LELTEKIEPEATIFWIFHHCAGAPPPAPSCIPLQHSHLAQNPNPGITNPQTMKKNVDLRRNSIYDTHGW
jgi:hypothetical protein